MSTTELHVRVRCSCVACKICIWLCETFGDFGKRERVPGESLERVERKLEKYYEKELHLDRLVRL